MVAAARTHMVPNKVFFFFFWRRRDERWLESEARKRFFLVLRRQSEDSSSFFPVLARVCVCVCAGCMALTGPSLLRPSVAPRKKKK